MVIIICSNNISDQKESNKKLVVNNHKGEVEFPNVIENYLLNRRNLAQSWVLLNLTLLRNF